MDLVQNRKEDFDKAIDHVKKDISGLRTGRATPTLVEDIVVEAYGTRQPLKAVASISVTDARTLSIEPWDKGLLKAVETGLQNSQIGINPVNDGRVIRLPMPALTQERREELVKILHQKLEQGRIALRQMRETVKSEIDNAEKAKTIGEDEKFKAQKKLEDLVKDYNDRIRVLGEEKEKEINTI